MKKVTIVYTWQCMICDEHGEGETSDSQAAKHTRTTRHATRTSGVPSGKEEK